MVIQLWAMHVEKATQNLWKLCWMLMLTLALKARYVYTSSLL